MTLEYKTTTQLEHLIAQARETEQAAKAALLVNGQPMYTPDEHNTRVREIETQRRQSIDTVTTEVQRRIQEIETDLLPTDADPVMRLQGDDLTRASALAPFVREDITAGNVAPKIRAVLKSGDRAAQAVWLRYLSVPGERGVPRWDGEVQSLVQELERVVKPADPKQAELTTRRDALSKLLLGEATTNYLQRTYGARR